MEEEGGGGSWVFAYHCGICYEGGGAGKKTHQIIGGLPKIAREKSKIIIAPLYINCEPSLRKFRKSH